VRRSCTSSSREFVLNLPDRPDGPATFALAAYQLLVLLAALSIEAWQIVLVAVVGGTLGASLQYLVGAPFEVLAMCAVPDRPHRPHVHLRQRARPTARTRHRPAEQRRAALGVIFTPEIAA
jgi:hypothetical protein